MAQSAAPSPASTSALPAAASNALPPPKVPVLRRAPSAACWTVTYSYQEDAKPTGAASASLPSEKPKAPAAPVDRLQSMTVTKSTRTYWEQAMYLSGKKSEKWIIDGVQLHIPPGGSEVALYPRPEVDDPANPWLDYNTADFPEIKGLAMEHYQGLRLWQGQPAYYFEWTRSGEKLTILLSEKQLPLIFTTPRVTETFVFSSPPQRLTPPEKFLKVLQTHKRGLQVLKRNPSPP
ncbi:MAG TPA: hypothetical protein VK970_10710 [Candidatus Methylacidiphilales bacterium]|nr:hypothetical protein [Candidatus Methylacidiphilales bacterium]